MIKEIRKFINENDIGEIINIQCQVGQWLPDWHPYEDFTKAYYARKDLGGGVALSLIHEIHLALDLAGLPTHVFGEITDYQKLNLEVDVCSDLMIKHKSGAVSQIHLDFLQKPSHRSGFVYKRARGLVGHQSTVLVAEHGRDQLLRGSRPVLHQQCGAQRRRLRVHRPHRRVL